MFPLNIIHLNYMHSDVAGVNLFYHKSVAHMETNNIVIGPLGTLLDI